MKNKEQRKILLYDIETSPNIGYVWGKWQQDVISFKEHWGLLCFAYKWYGDKKTQSYSLNKVKTEKELVWKLWELFDRADLLVAHNGKSFDTKKVNALFVKYGIKPPSPYKQIDTKEVAKRYFRFDSNKLDDLGDFLNVGRKLQTGGFDLWLGCISNNKKSWKKMIEYNKQDVELLEKIYKKMLPYIDTHPNLSMLSGDKKCRNCNGTHFNKRGFGINNKTRYQRIQCQDCGAWDKGDNIKV